MEKFECWMQANGLSESSIRKYSSAISGPLSKWARDNGLVLSSLTEISQPTQFAILLGKLREVDIFESRNVAGKSMYGSALNHYHKFLLDYSSELAIHDVLDMALDKWASTTTKRQMIYARVGQGPFRSDLIALWGKCSVTGYEDVSILTASHIKPWSLSSDREKLDKYNGLLLTPNLDRAFDNGLISFSNEGRIMISSQLKAPEFIGINQDMRFEPKPENKPYLEFHREGVFQG